MKIFNYGSINIDHIYQVPHLVAPGETISSTAYQQVLGGKGANQSIALAKAGAVVKHIGRCHKADQWALEQMQQAGVNCELTQLVDQPSGHAIIQVDAQAENSIILFGGANQSFSTDDFEHALSSAEAGDYLLLQNECNDIEQMINIALERQLKVVFNPSPMISNIATFPIDKIAMLVVNEIEISQLLGQSFNSTQQIVTAVRTHYSDIDVIVTLGAKGAMWINSQECIQVDALKVEVVDTTAAGDTFLGFLLAAIAQGQSYKSALTIGCKASALAVQSMGASSSIPSMAQVSAS